MDQESSYEYGESVASQHAKLMQHLAAPDQLKEFYSRLTDSDKAYLESLRIGWQQNSLD